MGPSRIGTPACRVANSRLPDLTHDYFLKNLEFAMKKLVSLLPILPRLHGLSSLEYHRSVSREYY